MITEKQVYEYSCSDCGHFWYTSQKMIMPHCSKCCGNKHWSSAEDEHWLFNRNYEREKPIKDSN